MEATATAIRLAQGGDTEGFEGYEVKKIPSESARMESMNVPGFLLRVSIPGKFQCWEWKGSICQKGYGVFRVAIDLTCRPVMAHRAMWWLPLDWHSPDGMCRLFLLAPEPELWMESNQGESLLYGYLPDMDKQEAVVYDASPMVAIANGMLRWLQSLSTADLEAVRERLGDGL